MDALEDSLGEVAERADSDTESSEYEPTTPEDTDDHFRGYLESDHEEQVGSSEFPPRD